MNIRLLDLLRCPYCGTQLTLIDNAALVRDATLVQSGVLGCQCCAFPVVAGIPVLLADDRTRTAMHALERDQGRSETALPILLGLDTDRATRHRELLVDPGSTVFREALRILCPDGDAEGDYLLHRFSDPSYRVAEAVLNAVGQAQWPFAGSVLDLCGGAGHLTRVIAAQRGAAPTDVPVTGSLDMPLTVTADLVFWKLWLGKQYVSPGSTAICCDANHPLPFARHTFSTVVLADAFPYIWHKRLLAEEMMRLVGESGVIVMPHLHNALGDNYSAGDTLPPDAYHALYAAYHPRVYADSALFTQLLEEQIIDLGCSPDDPRELGAEPSLTLVASRRADLFSRYELPPDPPVTGTLVVNPLYEIERLGQGSRLTLAFPTPEYAAEFADCRRYLPDVVTVGVDLTAPQNICAATLGPEYADLRRRRIIIDAPPRYC